MEREASGDGMRPGGINNDDATRPCAVCSGKKGCSHRRSNEAPGFSRAGGRQLWSAMRRGTVCAQGNPQRRRHASVFGMQWKKGGSHRRSNEAPGFSRAGGYVPWYAPRQYRAMPRSRHCPAMPAESNVRPRLSGLPFDSAFLLLVIDHINDINAAIYKNRAIVGR